MWEEDETKEEEETRIEKDTMSNIIFFPCSSMLT